MELHPVRCATCGRHVPVYLIYQDDSPDEAVDGYFCRVCTAEEKE